MTAPLQNISRIGLGCMPFSGVYGFSDQTAMKAVIDQAIDVGVNFFDTADTYGNGQNETDLGSYFLERGPAIRSKAIIATKFGFRSSSVSSGKPWIDGSPNYLNRAVDASLKRLKTDVIDLYYYHRRDLSVPIEETVGAMAELVRHGKVRALGLSEVSLETLKRAHHVFPITALQSEYSLWSRDLEKEIIPWCAQHGVKVIPWSPLGRGFLTGTFLNSDPVQPNDFRFQHPRFQPENFEKNKILLKVFCDRASTLGLTPAQLALAWIINQSPEMTPIPGTRSPSRVIENWKSTSITLTAEDLSFLSDLFSQDQVAGKRYPEELMDTLGN